MYLLELNAVTKRYKHAVGINQVNLYVEKGKIYTLLGSNGAGKSTLLKLACGLLQPDYGEVKLFGVSLEKGGRAQLRRAGILQEVPAFYPNLTARENLEILKSLRGFHKRNETDEILEKMNLTVHQHGKVKGLSICVKQRLGLAMAMMHEPELLILDEPFKGLDPQGILDIRCMLAQLAKEKETAILTAGHGINDAELISDTIGFLKAGELVLEKSIKELKQECRQFIKAEVSHSAQAIPVMERILRIKDFEIVDDNQIRIYDLTIDREKLIRIFVENQISIRELSIQKGSLEEYFMKVTGGQLFGKYN